MPGIARAGLDTAGGIIQGGGQSRVYVEGYLVAVLDDPVAPHGSAPHNDARMSEASSTVYFGGKQVCREGDKATCNHTATGSSVVFCN